MLKGFFMDVRDQTGSDFMEVFHSCKKNYRL
jgi:hypothetical protein